MIEETAIVTKCEGDFAWVEAQRKTACGQCQVNKGCGTSVLARVVGNKVSRMRALNPVNARQGDSVIIGLHESALLAGSIALYLVPLVSLLLFAITGKVIAEQMMIESVEAVSILFAIIGMLISIAWLKLFSRRVAKDSRYQPVILKRLPAADIAVSNVVHS